MIVVVLVLSMVMVKEAVEVDKSSVMVVVVVPETDPGIVLWTCLSKTPNQMGRVGRLKSGETYVSTTPVVVLVAVAVGRSPSDKV